MSRLLRSLQRWVGRLPPAPEWPAVAQWAAEAGFGYRRERDDQGFVVQGPLGARTWRLEWGPPQRDYLQGPELRLRCELGLPGDQQMLLMSTGLMERLEREAFGRFTEQAQTEVDFEMPEEMRWLALFRKVPLARWRSLRNALGAVASHAGSLEAWLDDAGFVQWLDRAACPVDDRPPLLDPLVLMTLRGRLYLRTRCDDPDPAVLHAAQQVFVRAAARAQAVAAAMAATSSAGPSTQGGSTLSPQDSGSTAWQTRLGPDGD